MNYTQPQRYTIGEHGLLIDLPDSSSFPCAKAVPFTNQFYNSIYPSLSVVVSAGPNLYLTITNFSVSNMD